MSEHSIMMRQGLNPTVNAEFVDTSICNNLLGFKSSLLSDSWGPPLYYGKIMKRLYKFVKDENAVINIARGSLKFTPVSSLNDPTEVLPFMDQQEVRASLEKLRESGYTPDQFDWLHCQYALLNLLERYGKGTGVRPVPNTLAEANQIISSPVYENFGYMEKELLATIKHIRERVGFLSLSERYDSLPMWAHYANQGKGFVIAFKDLSSSFPGDDTVSLNALKPVVYTKRVLGMTFDPSTQDRLFFYKNSDWSYEREWRVVTPLNTCRCCRSSKHKIFLRDVDPNLIDSVICGWHIKSSEMSQLRDELKQINDNIRVMSASCEAGEVTLSND